MQMEMFPAAEYYDPAYENPMVVKFGKGPDAKCKTCKYLTHTQYANKYIKCKNRGTTHGVGTDHKAGYSACKLYEVSS